VNRTLTSSALVVGVACWVAGQAVLPDAGAHWPDRLDAVAAARGAESLATVLLFLGGALLVVGAVGLAPAILPGRGRRLLQAGTVLLGLGGVWLTAGRAAFNLQMLDATAPDVPRESGLAVLSAPDGPEWVVFPLCLLALLVGPVLLGIGATRSGAVPWWPLVLWVAGIAGFVATEFTAKAGEIAGLAWAGAGLVWMTLGVLRAVPAGSPAVPPQPLRA
jgi:hypothetical protein